MTTFVAKTSKFWIEADENLGAAGIQSGQFIAQLCESDYDRLVTWFGGSIQVAYRSPDTPGFIRVLITNGTGGGWNNGPGGFIKLAPFPEHDSMGLVFVAELSEMFMNTQNAGWDPRNSKGEALSRLLSEEAYPAAPNMGLFFTAQSWLGTGEDPAGSGNRHDWVSANEGTDKNFVSIGCAILFLNYLRWQLKAASLVAIVAASATTLEGLYQNITGKTGGFQPFSNLLNRFFPIGTMPAVGDNPFPLLDAAERMLTISTSSTGTGIKVVGGGFVEEQFLGCPRKRYSYTLLATTETIKATAVPVGFGVPAVAWTINGLAAVDGATITPNVVIFRPNPSLPGGGTSTSATIALMCTISNHSKTLNLSLAGPLTGQAQLTIGAIANDVSDAPASQTHASAMATLATEFVLFESSYHQDAKQCASSFVQRFPAEVAPPFDRLSQAIAIILTLPDPLPPEFQRALVLVEQIALISAALKDVKSIALRESLQRFLRSRVALAPSVLRSLGNQQQT